MDDLVAFNKQYMDEIDKQMTYQVEIYDWFSSISIPKFAIKT